MGVGAGGLCRPAACPSCRAWSLLSSFPRASLRRGSPPALPLLPIGRRGERLPLKGQAFLSACAYRCPGNRFAAVTTAEGRNTPLRCVNSKLRYAPFAVDTPPLRVSALSLRDSRFTKSGVRQCLRHRRACLSAGAYRCPGQRFRFGFVRWLRAKSPCALPSLSLSRLVCL